MTNIEKFKEFYSKEKNALETEINHFHETFIQENNPMVRDNLERFKNINSEGKRIRGILVLLGYYLETGETAYSIPLAMAYEIFQTAILVHDDVIDKDEKRRGKPTIHYENMKNYQKFSNSKEEVTHLGNSIGICMGDYGLYTANQVIAKSYEQDKNLGKILQYFNDTVLKTIKGELLDVVLPFESKYKNIKQDVLEDSIFNIYRLKTAYYTIIGPIGGGLLLAGASAKQMDDITSFGEKVGIAFQIQDDLLAIYSNEMGKVNGSDIREFKQTILYSHVSTTSYKDQLLKYYGSNSVTSETIKEVQRILEESGSKKYAEDKMNELYDSSIQELQNITWIKEEKKQILMGLVEYLKTRKK